MSANRRPSGRPGPAATSILWGFLAALVLAHALAAALSGTWLWGLSHLRYLAPWGWALWLVSALLLAPPLGRALTPALEALGARLGRGWPGPALAAAAGAVLVLALPDRTYFVGDSLLRFDAAQIGLPAGYLSPQAFPLDVGLHSALPAWARATFSLPPALAGRLVGALDAALLAVLAIAFARRLRLHGAALLAAAALCWWGGWLALFTGFAKAFSEMAVAVAAVAVLGLDALRGRRALALGLVAAAALALHRSAIGLLPAAVWALWGAFGRGTGGRARVTAGLAALVVAGALVAIGPQLVAAMRAFDAGHFAAPGESAGAALARIFAPLRLLDLANQLLFLVPLAPLAALAAARAGEPVLPGRERVFLALLAAPFVVALFLLRPAQGIARDFDDFAAGGVAVALLAAVGLAWALRAAPRSAWLAAAVVAGTAAPTLQFLALETDLPRALARVRALAEGPPLRAADERARLWDYVGGREFRAGRNDLAAADLRRAALLTPSPRIVLGWARAAGRAGDWDEAERAYRLLLERAGDDSRLRAAAYYGLGGVALERSDDLAAGRAYLEQALGARPDYPEAERLLEQVAREEVRRGTVPPARTSDGGEALP